MITDLDKVIDLLKSEGPRFDDARAALGRVRAAMLLLPSKDRCPRCLRAYRFEEEAKHRLCVVCVVEITTPGVATKMAVQTPNPDVLATVPLADGTATAGVAPEDHACADCGTVIPHHRTFCHRCIDKPHVQQPEPVTRAEYEQGAKATAGVESQLVERVEALERHATAQVAIDKAGASHAANRVREVEGRVAALESRAAKHEAVTRALVRWNHEVLDCQISNRKADQKVGAALREALRAAGWDKP